MVTDLAVKVAQNELLSMIRKQDELPILKLLQDDQSEDAQLTGGIGGQFIVGLSNPLDAPLNIIPVGVLGNNSYTEEDENGNFVVLCFSADQITGVGEPGGDCGTCELKDWEGRTPPPCQEQIKLLVYVLDTKTFAIWYLRRTMLRTGTKIKTLGNAIGWGNFCLQVIPEQQKKGTYRWLSPAIKRVPLPDGSREGMMIGVPTLLPVIEANAEDDAD